MPPEARGAAVGRREGAAAPLDRTGGRETAQCRGGQRGRSPGTDHWAFAPPAQPAPPPLRDDRPRPHPGRSLHPEGARGPRADPRSRRRSRHLDPPRQLRPDGPAAAARGDRGVRRRPRSGRLRAGSSTACWPRHATASAGASTGWMRRATPIPTATSAPTPTGRSPIAIATTSSARSTPIGRSTRSSASNWPATSWPATVAGRTPRPRRSTSWSRPISCATARTAPARATATPTRSAPTSTPCSRERSRSSARRSWD